MDAQRFILGLKEDVLRFAARYAPFLATSETLVSGDGNLGVSPHAELKVYRLGEDELAADYAARIKGFGIGSATELLCIPYGDDFVILGELQNGTATHHALDSDRLNFLSQIAVVAGAVDPENAVTAVQGSLYLRGLSDGTAAIYVKHTGDPSLPDNDTWQELATKRTLGMTPDLFLLSAAGSTATGSVTDGNDTSGQIQLTPNGAGIAAGSVVQLVFTTFRTDAKYDVFFSAQSAAARALVGQIGVTDRTATDFKIVTPTALTPGSSYQWGYLIVPRA